MATSPPKEQTPAERVLLNTGPCTAILCTYGCDGFAFTGHADGFRVCICTHTQHSHEKSST